MVSQPPTDTPFGLQANVASGLAYLFTWLGGLVMLLGGGTNKSVKWAAAQSITLWVTYFIVYFVLGFVFAMLSMMMAGLALIISPLYMLLGLAGLVLWIWTTVSGFQGKDIRVPVIAGIAEKIFREHARVGFIPSGIPG